MKQYIKRHGVNTGKIKNNGIDSQEAICIMCADYGGVARKQAIMEENAIHADTINKINDMVCRAVEKNLS